MHHRHALLAAKSFLSVALIWATHHSYAVTTTLEYEDLREAETRAAVSNELAHAVAPLASTNDLAEAKADLEANIASATNDLALATGGAIATATNELWQSSAAAFMPQTFTESDPTVPAWAKVADPPYLTEHQSLTNYLQKGEAAYWHTTIGSGANQGDYWSFLTGYGLLIFNSTKQEQTTYLASGIEYMPDIYHAYKYNYPTNSGTFALQSEIPTDYLTQEKDPVFGVWRTNTTVKLGYVWNANNDNNVAIAAHNVEARRNVAIGSQAAVEWVNPSSTIPNTTDGNVAIGYNAKVRSTGIDNRGVNAAVAIGNNALATNAHAVVIGNLAHSHGEGTCNLSADSLDKIFLGDTNIVELINAAVNTAIASREISSAVDTSATINGKTFTATPLRSSAATRLTLTLEPGDLGAQAAGDYLTQELDPAAAGIASNVVTQAYIQERLQVYLYIGQDNGIYVHTPTQGE